MALRHLVSTDLLVKIPSETLKMHQRFQLTWTLKTIVRTFVSTPNTSHGNVSRLQNLQDSFLPPNVSRAHHCCTNSFHSSSSVFAGHSKWSNIKHIKGAQDRLKGQKASELAKQIQAVLTKNPETNPKLNYDLANLIKIARSNNIPNETIDRTIDRVSKLRDPSSISVFDGRGLSNTAILIECFSLKPVHTKMLLQGIVKKFGFNLNSPALDLFDHKGIVDIDLPEDEVEKARSDPDDFSLDKYIDLAIEAGAEDVTLKADSDRPYLQFICGPQDLENVQSNLEAEGITITASEKTYIPNLVVPVSKEFLGTIDKLVDKLDLNPDVVKYHFNVELEESS